jgi:hypothetical protein
MKSLRANTVPGAPKDEISQEAATTATDTCFFEMVLASSFICGHAHLLSENWNV